MQDAWDFAEQSPEPPLEALYEDVLVDTTSDAHVKRPSPPIEPERSLCVTYET